MNGELHRLDNKMAMGQKPVPAVNIPIPTRISSKMCGEFTYPKMVVLTHSQIIDGNEAFSLGGWFFLVSESEWAGIAKFQEGDLHGSFQIFLFFRVEDVCLLFLFFFGGGPRMSKAGWIEDFQQPCFLGSPYFDAMPLTHPRSIATLGISLPPCFGALP